MELYSVSESHVDPAALADSVSLFTEWFMLKISAHWFKQVTLVFASLLNHLKTCSLVCESGGTILFLCDRLQN